MDENDKRNFRKEYGYDEYLIIKKYNLWNLDPFILAEVENAVNHYLCSRTFSEEKKYPFSYLEHRYIHILGLMNLDEENLNNLDKAISYLVSFRNEHFDNQEAFFKEKLFPI